MMTVNPQLSWHSETSPAYMIFHIFSFFLKFLDGLPAQWKLRRLALAGHQMAGGVGAARCKDGKTPRFNEEDMMMDGRYHGGQQKGRE